MGDIEAQGMQRLGNAKAQTGDAGDAEAQVQSGMGMQRHRC
jgi:hypothetical protein